MLDPAIAQAFKFGQLCRHRGLDLQAANVELARSLGWQQRSDFRDDLLDACEDGWRDVEETLNAPDEDFE